MNINITWPTIVGIIGTLLVLLAFFLLQARKLHGNGAVFQLLNAIGAAGIIVSLFYAFNLASMVLEIAWLLISIYGLVVSFRQRRGPVTRRLRRGRATAPRGPGKVRRRSLLAGDREIRISVGACVQATRQPSL